MSAKDRALASAVICSRVIQSHEFTAAQFVGCYLPTDDEVDTTRIFERAWRANKRTFVPVTDSHGAMTFCEVTADSLVTRSNFGTWEPASGTLVDAKNLDVVITPLAAFDSKRHRIGMGGGYFDRCFQFLRNRRKWLRPKLIGVAFRCQEVQNITPNSWDVPLYKCICEAD